MDNNPYNSQYNPQYNATGPANTGNNYVALNSPSPQPKNKKIIAIIGAAVVTIIALIIILIFTIRGSQNPNSLPSGNINSATLQIYAALNDELSMDNIQDTVKNINGDAVVNIDDGYGTIEIPSSPKEFISFFFETEGTDEEDINEAPSEAGSLSDSTEYSEGENYVEKTYGPNIAYGFTYVRPIDEEDSVTISPSGDGIFYYYDGLDIYEFPTKQEAIDAYLAPVL